MTHEPPASVELAPCPICGAYVTDEEGFADNFGNGSYRYASCSECSYQADLADHRRLSTPPARPGREILAPFQQAIDDCEGAPDDMAIGDASYSTVTVGDIKNLLALFDGASA